jgi:predicted dehydrogenase
MGRTASSASPEGDVGLTIVGENAYLDLDLTDGVLHGRIDGEDVHYENDVAVRWMDYQGGNDAFRKELDEFLAAVQTDDPSRPRSPYADALRSFELTLAVTESLETNTPIEVR